MTTPHDRLHQMATGFVEAKILLASLFESIAPGGQVVIHENLIDPSRVSPRDSALFAVNMLAMTRGGRSFLIFLKRP